MLPEYVLDIFVSELECIKVQIKAKFLYIWLPCKN